MVPWVPTSEAPIRVAMRPVRFLSALLVMTVLVVGAALRIGPLPPLGRFLDPSHGVWAIATSARLPRAAEAVLPGLGDSVLVEYDDRGVPHIFASSTTDAAAALGYVVARDRLFQLEAQTRVTEGTLTELAGRSALGVDRNRRALGLAWSAHRQDSVLDPTSPTARLLDAYAAGVNAWIDGLETRDLPFEYHLLGAQPRRWQRVFSLYLLREMGYTLSYTTLERWRADVAERVGGEAERALFPTHSPIVEPIVTVQGERYPRFDATPVPPPGGGKGRQVVASGGIIEPPLAASGRRSPPGAEGSGEVGSNNWVVAPTHSASGHALLAGDPHLQMTLPSIWYEAHLVVPGQEDVYGVTLPGAPGIVIGFNRDVAWSFTNAGDDLADYYREQLDDSIAPSAYWVDGAWRPLERRVEQYRDRSGRVLRTDTLYATHRGPLIEWDDGTYVSLAWTVFDGGHAFEALFGAARATSTVQWLTAMEPFGAVTQNGAVADRNGDIAILATGAYPARPTGVTGDTLLDGTTTAGDWRGVLPPSSYPRAFDPRQGYLASANQEPVDPRHDARYLGSDWPAPWRALRINELLRTDSAVTLEDLRAFQTDPGSQRAELFVPLMLETGGAREAGSHGKERTADSALALLAQWDNRYTKGNTRAVLFELAMSELRRRAWDELSGLALPGDAQLWRLMSDPQSPWWDVLATDSVTETRDDVVRASLAAALDTARARYGEPAGTSWRWDRIRYARIDHLLGMRSLSARNVPVQGGNGTLNPSSGSGSHGASWRMVVELGDTIAARTIYPGGQSGNPASPRYDDRIDTWSAGALEAVLFPRHPEDLSGDHVTSVLVLRPPREP